MVLRDYTGSNRNDKQFFARCCMKMIRVPVQTLACVFLFTVVFAVDSNSKDTTTSQPAENLASEPAESNTIVFKTILQRYRQILLATPRQSDDSQVSDWLDSMKPNGSWDDLDYDDQSRAGWQPYQHLVRMKAIADAVSREGGKFHDDKQARAQVIQQLEFWTQHRPQSKNWWYNRIGTPRMTRDVVVLLGDHLPATLRDQAIEVLQQNRLGGTGANLLWTAETTLHLGCLQADAKQVKRAADAIWNEIQVGQREGIQSDWSFFQHDTRVQTFSYGKFFLEISVHTAAQLEGTRWEMPAAKRALISNYLLQGMQWMSRGIMTVPSTMDRQFSRPNRLSYADVRPQLKLWKQVDQDREAELQRFLDRQNGVAEPVDGFRHFRNGDLSVLHRPGGSLFLKTISNRTKPTETTNRENLKGRRYLHSSDHYILADGRELEGIQPTLDWHRVPGITVASLETTQARRSFTGGMGDGQSGLVTMDYARLDDADDQRQTVEARLDFEVKKSWFFHGNQMICLLAGWKMGDRDHPDPTTSVEQRLLEGDVMYADHQGNLRQLATGKQFTGRFRWALHDGVGYLPLGDEEYDLYAGPASGTWAEINFGYRDRTEAITKDVFRMYLRHGSAPQATGYVVVLDADEEKMKRLYQNRHWRVVSNDSQCQAISFDDQLMASCLGPSSVTVPADTEKPKKQWELNVDSPCLLQISDQTISISCPDQQSQSIRLSIDKQEYELTIPAGGEPVTVNRKPDGKISIDSPARLIDNNDIATTF